MKPGPVGVDRGPLRRTDGKFRRETRNRHPCRPFLYALRPERVARLSAPLKNCVFRLCDNYHPSLQFVCQLVTRAPGFPSLCRIVSDLRCASRHFGQFGRPARLVPFAAAVVRRGGVWRCNSQGSDSLERSPGRGDYTRSTHTLPDVRVCGGARRRCLVSADRRSERRCHPTT